MTITRPGPIVCLGDSIAAAGWPAELQEELCRLGFTELRCLNAGIRGNTSSQGLRRLQKDVLLNRPRIVIVQFGFNDCNIILNGPRPRVSPEDFRSNLRQLFLLIRQSGAEVYLILNHCTLVFRLLPDGQPYETHSQHYTEIAASAAKEAQVETVDMRGLFPGSDMEVAGALAADGIHLNAVGVRRYAAIVAEFLTARLVLPRQ